MNELEKNYLAHHGILGQRWHHRNGPPYPLDAGDHSKSEKEAGYKKSLGGGRNEEMYDRKTRKRAAKEAAKDLNRNDQEMAENRYKFNQAKKKYDKYEKKMLKAKEGSKKKEKYASKSLDAWLDSEEAREAIDKGQDRAREILGYLEENGYDVKMKDTMRSVARGENLVKSMLLTGLATGAATAIAGPAGMSAAAVAFTTDRVKGTKFKVKDNQEKQKKSKVTVDDIEKRAIEMNGGKPYNSLDEYVEAYKKAGKELNNKEKSSKQKRKEYEEEVRRRENSDREAVKKVVDKDKSTIAKQAAQQMAKDAIRWAKEGSEQHSSTKGKSQDQIAKMFEKKIMDKIMNENTGYAETDSNGNIYFQIDGIPEFGGGQPQDVWYNPKTKKITGMGWT